MQKALDRIRGVLSRKVLCSSVMILHVKDMPFNYVIGHFGVESVPDPFYRLGLLGFPNRRTKPHAELLKYEHF